MSKKCEMIRPWAAATFLVASNFALCQEKPTELLVARDIAYDVASRTATFKLENRGNQEVTAFEYSIGVVGNAGTHFKGAETIDLLPLFSLRSVASITLGHLATSFGPGEVYPVRWQVRPDWGDIVGTRIQVEVATVIYADGSALGNPTSIRTVFSQRKSQAEDLQKVIAAVLALPRENSEDELKTLAVKFKNSRTQSSLIGEVSRAHGRNGWQGVDAAMQGYRAQASGLIAGSIQKER